MWVQHVGAGLWELIVPADHLREAFYGAWQILTFNGEVAGSTTGSFSWGGRIPGAPAAAPVLTVTETGARQGWLQHDRILGALLRL